MGFDVDIGQMLSGISEEQARQMMSNLDEEDVQQVMEYFADEMLIPHLDDIRTRASSDPDPRQVRQFYQQMSEEEREEEFYNTLDELVAALVLCRERPTEGFEDLKAFLRDPYTTEALLLIFENEEHIDPEYSEQLKEFGAEHMRWIGAMVLPEMYDEEEVDEVLARFNINPDDADAAPGGAQ